MIRKTQAKSIAEAIRAAQGRLLGDEHADCREALASLGVEIGALSDCPGCGEAEAAHERVVCPNCGKRKRRDRAACAKVLCKVCAYVTGTESNE